VTHVSIAFLGRETIIDPTQPHNFWANITELRGKFVPGTKMLIAIGGWGEDRLFSWAAAVPGRPSDMMAFTRKTLPRIMNHLDFLNVMTYDLMNRRDNVTDHHTGVKNSIEGLEAYITAGVAPQKLNLGLAFYVKWFETEPGACEVSSLPSSSCSRC